VNAATRVYYGFRLYGEDDELIPDYGEKEKKPKLTKSQKKRLKKERMMFGKSGKVVNGADAKKFMEDHAKNKDVQEFVVFVGLLLSALTIASRNHVRCELSPAAAEMRYYLVGLSRGDYRILNRYKCTFPGKQVTQKNIQNVIDRAIVAASAKRRNLRSAEMEEIERMLRAAHDDRCRFGITVGPTYRERWEADGAAETGDDGPTVAGAAEVEDGWAKCERETAMELAELKRLYADRLEKEMIKAAEERLRAEGVVLDDWIHVTYGYIIFNDLEVAIRSITVTETVYSEEINEFLNEHFRTLNRRNYEAYRELNRIGMSSDDGSGGESSADAAHRAVCTDADNDLMDALCACEPFTLCWWEAYVNVMEFDLAMAKDQLENADDSNREEREQDVIDAELALVCARSDLGFMLQVLGVDAEPAAVAAVVEPTAAEPVAAAPVVVEPVAVAAVEPVAVATVAVATVAASVPVASTVFKSKFSRQVDDLVADLGMIMDANTVAAPSASVATAACAAAVEDTCVALLKAERAAKETQRVADCKQEAIINARRWADDLERSIAKKVNKVVEMEQLVKAAKRTEGAKGAKGAKGANVEDAVRAVAKAREELEVAREKLGDAYKRVIAACEAAEEARAAAAAAASVLAGLKLNQ
jgi:hypothetical protein